MFIIKKNNIEEVELINKGKLKSLVRFKNEDILIDNGNIYFGMYILFNNPKLATTELIDKFDASLKQLNMTKPESKYAK